MNQKANINLKQNQMESQYLVQSQELGTPSWQLY